MERHRLNWTGLGNMLGSEPAVPRNDVHESDRINTGVLFRIQFLLSFLKLFGKISLEEVEYCNALIDVAVVLIASGHLF